MKLSDAILLGSTVLAAKPGRQYFSDGQAGCALGMAAIANGCHFRTVYGVPPKERRTLGAEDVWGDWVLVVMARPCHCWRLRVPRKMRIKDIIAHLFDYHVMARKNWTLDQLVAWVKTVEPQPTEAGLGFTPTPEGRSVPPETAALLDERADDMEPQPDELMRRQVRQVFEARLQLAQKN